MPGPLISSVILSGAYERIRAAGRALGRIHQVVALRQEASVRHGAEYTGLPLDVIALLVLDRAGQHA